VIQRQRLLIVPCTKIAMGKTLDTPECDEVDMTLNSPAPRVTSHPKPTRAPKHSTTIASLAANVF